MGQPLRPPSALPQAQPLRKGELAAHAVPAPRLPRALEFQWDPGLGYTQEESPGEALLNPHQPKDGDKDVPKRRGTKRR